MVAKLRSFLAIFTHRVRSYNTQLNLATNRCHDDVFQNQYRAFSFYTRV